MRFDVMLGRLLVHRRADVGALVRAAGVLPLELDAVLAGDDATPALLRRLAPALGLHVADLFRHRRGDLTAARGTTPWDVGSVLDCASGMAPEPRVQLHEFVRSLPVRPPAQPPPPRTDPPWYRPCRCGYSRTETSA